MKLCNFFSTEESLRAGVILDSDPQVVFPLFGDNAHVALSSTNLAAALSLLSSYFPPADGLPLAKIQWAPPLWPIPSFRDFYSFENHVRTARKKRGLEMVPEWYHFPVFYFSNPYSIIGHQQALPYPRLGEWLDFELEIGCVISKTCSHISPEEADEYIGGYTLINDWSLRDLQREEMKVGLGPAKGKDFATSVGPYLLPKDAIEHRRKGKGFDLELTAKINGKEVSRGNWRDIHYSFEEMVARASQNTTLFPGDLIGSGTVGTGCILELEAEKVGGWLKIGDVVTLEGEELGVLENKIIPSL